MNRSNIWNFAQNKPSLVVDDLIEMLGHTELGYHMDQEYEKGLKSNLYSVLLKRGVFKWLAVRRDLIKLKNAWKQEIVGLQGRKTEYQKGYLKALEKCRADVRALCHSDRWRAPDNDRRAQKWLKNLPQ